MSLVFAGLAGAVIAFLFVFKSGRLLVVRHIVGLALAALVTAFLCMFAFFTLHPFGSASWARMYNTYVLGGIIASIFGPIAGSLVAFVWRRRSAS